MFEELEKKLSEGGSLAESISGEPTQRDLQIATAVLLMKMVDVDGAFEGSEVKGVAQVLTAHFGLSDAEAGDILGVADFLSRDSEKVEQFVTMLNQSFNESQRQVVLAMLWKVVLADFKVDESEEKLASQMREQLGLSEELAQEARQMAEQNKV